MSAPVQFSSRWYPSGGCCAVSGFVPPGSVSISPSPVLRSLVPPRQVATHVTSDCDVREVGLTNWTQTSFLTAALCGACVSVSGNLQWTTSAQSLQDGARVQTCSGQTVDLAWSYNLTAADHLVDVEWYFSPAGYMLPPTPTPATFKKKMYLLLSCFVVVFLCLLCLFDCFSLLLLFLVSKILTKTESLNT